MARKTGVDACAHIPVRTCLGCRRRAAKHELLRVVVGGSAEDPQRRVLVPDPTGTAPGRGAYVHLDPECVEAAARRRAFGRALRAGTTAGVEAVLDEVARRTPAGEPPGAEQQDAHQEEQHPC